MHTNGFGGGVLKTALNADLANDFIGYLLSSEGSQRLIADPSFEYPAAIALKPVPLVESFGPFIASEVHWTDVANQLAKANSLLESVGWDK